MPMTLNPTVYSRIATLTSSAKLQALLAKASENIVLFACYDLKRATSLYMSTRMQLADIPPDTLLLAHVIGIINDRISLYSPSASAADIIRLFLSYMPSHTQALHDRVANLVFISRLLDRYRDLRSVLGVCHQLRVTARGA